MQKRLIPVSPNLDNNIHHWLEIYQPFLNDKSCQPDDYHLVTDILRASLHAFCIDKGYLLNHQFRVGLPVYEYATFKNFWLYMYSLRNLSSAVVHNHGSLPEQLAPTTTKNQLDAILYFVSNHHGREQQVIDGFQAAFSCTDRVVYHYSQHILYRKEV